MVAMASVSRAIRNRDFNSARSLLAEEIEDQAELDRVLTALICTEHPPPSEERGQWFERPETVSRPTGQPPNRQLYLDVLELLAAGVCREDAAAILGIGLEALKTRLKVAITDLQARNRTHAVAIAIRRGLI